MLPLLTSLGDRCRGPVWRRVRMGVALLCLLIAVAALVGAARRPAARGPGISVAVVVAARTLPAGRVLRRGDLTIARWPESARPPAALAVPKALLGERLAGPVGTGEPVTRTRLVGSSLTAGLAPGIVATTVLVGAEVARLVHPGDRIDLVAGAADPSLVADPSYGAGPPPGAGPSSTVDTSPAEAALVARGVLVLAVLAPSTTDAFGGSATQLVLATGRHLALHIFAMQAAVTFAVVLDPP